MKKLGKNADIRGQNLIFFPYAPILFKFCVKKEYKNLSGGKYTIFIIIFVGELMQYVYAQHAHKKTNCTYPPHKF